MAATQKSPAKPKPKAIKKPAVKKAPAKKPASPKKVKAQKVTSSKKTATKAKATIKKSSESPSISMGDQFDDQLGELLAKFDEIMGEGTSIAPIVITKTEHHQVSYFYEFALDIDKLREIYPDYGDEHLAELMDDIRDGSMPIEGVLEDAWHNGVEILWDGVGEDAWTFRKGGYDETYGLKDD